MAEVDEQLDDDAPPVTAAALAETRGSVERLISDQGDDNDFTAPYLALFTAGRGVVIGTRRCAAARRLKNAPSSGDGTYELFRAHFSKRPERNLPDGRPGKATYGLVDSLRYLLADSSES